MRDYYIFKFGRMKRKDNTIFFEYVEDKEEKKVIIPINDIDSIYIWRSRF